MTVSKPIIAVARPARPPPRDDGRLLRARLPPARGPDRRPRKSAWRSGTWARTGSRAVHRRATAAHLGSGTAASPLRRTAGPAWSAAALGIRVGWRVEDLLDRSLLDDPPRVHHRGPVREFGDDAHVMGDPQNPERMPSCSSPIRAKISACVETSRAVVGSSAMMSGGASATAIAIITRWRMPPDSWCVQLRHCGGLPDLDLGPAPLPRPSPLAILLAEARVLAESSPHLPARPVTTGLSAAIASCAMHPSSLALTLRNGGSTARIRPGQRCGPGRSWPPTWAAARQRRAQASSCRCRSRRSRPPPGQPPR